MNEEDALNPAEEAAEAPEIEAAEEAETGEAGGGSEVFGGANVDEAKVGELSQRALTFVYGNAEVFANLIKLLKATKGTGGIKEATIGVMDRLVSEGIDASQEELMAIGVIVMMHLFDMAQRIGVVPEVNEQLVMQTAQEAAQLWAQRHGGQQSPAQQPAQPGLLDAGGAQ